MYYICCTSGFIFYLNKAKFTCAIYSKIVLACTLKNYYLPGWKEIKLILRTINRRNLFVQRISLWPIWVINTKITGCGCWLLREPCKHKSLELITACFFANPPHLARLGYIHACDAEKLLIQHQLLERHRINRRLSRVYISKLGCCQWSLSLSALTCQVRERRSCDLTSRCLRWHIFFAMPWTPIVSIAPRSVWLISAEA